MTIGFRIKSARKAIGLSQEALGRSVGVSKVAISKIENGSTKKTSLVVKISRSLGVTPQWLEYGEGEGRSTPLELTDQERSMLAKFRSLNEKDKIALERILSSLCRATYE